MTPRASGVGLRRWGGGTDDGHALAAAWADPDVQRWTAVPEDRSVDHAERWIAGEAERRTRRLAMDLVIVDPAVTEVVQGEVGLVPVPGQDGCAEVGYWLLPAWRGSGRATTAVALFAAMALEEEGFTQLLARTQLDNPASGRVVQRAGFQRAATSDGGTVLWTLGRSPESTPEGDGDRW